MIRGTGREIMAFPATSSGAQHAVARLGARTWTRMLSWVATLRRHGALAEAVAQEPQACAAVVLAFPAGGYANLVRLQRDMKARFTGLGFTDLAPFMLRMVPGATPRLWIDDSAFVEFCPAQRGYRFVCDNDRQARLTLETCDFASVEAMVGHYIFSCFMRGSEERAAR